MNDDQPTQPLTDACPCQPVYVHTYGLDRETWEKLFDRVADAAHALDEAVSCSGGNECALCAAQPTRAELAAEVDRLRAALTALGRNERAACNRSLSLQEENDRLRKQVQDYHQSADAHVAKFERQHGRLQNAEDRITAVVAIHKPTGMDGWGHRTCQHCDTPGYYQEWPCPTLVALGFEEQ